MVVQLILCKKRDCFEQNLQILPLDGSMVLVKKVESYPMIILVGQLLLLSVDYNSCRYFLCSKCCQLVSQFMHALRTGHLNVVYKILNYLKNLL